MSITLLIKKTAQNRPLQHLLFWAVSFYVLARLFAYSDELATVDIIYTFLFHLSILLAVYVNLIWLIPAFLTTKKYGLYFLLLVVIVFCSIGFNLLTFNYLSDHIFPGYYFIAYYGFWEISQFIVAYIVITSLIKLSKGWFRYLETKDELQRLETEKKTAELSALKSQVNPHFLFNSLNNLYSLALDNDERTPGIILMLSQTMRYLLYESNADFVPLEKEVEHLQNYVEMQRLRVGEKARISFEVMGDTTNKQVAPLLFLPLVENGFKHGVKGETEGAFIKMLLQVLDNQLVFKTENNKGEVDDIEKNSTTGGVGLQNLRRRLDLLYPNKHHLEITDGIGTFTVVLKIDLP
ncbi:MAG: histidine kinase [Saprospiraceae bacterium]|nr:histidine kinase [Saprospiraceae bacterium]MCF8249458.1 histidine kinase [Saprospiraceae bacterium]MCF8279112.1 histidine kinase [Bacteroidales bacterium]MCF8311587.1 histidine kinase [Saprospiraceae bacterium]MCF8440077.1 histidine kinase [Saprospiraceae bacterium]